jgi:hypothetical protein
MSISATLPSASLDRAIGFMSWLYENERGYIEIVAGETDPHKPDKIKLLMPTRDDPTCINTRRWFYYDPDRPDLIEATAAYVVELASRHGNVFCGVRLYDKRAKAQNTRKEEVHAAQPSRGHRRRPARSDYPLYHDRSHLGDLGRNNG